MAFISVSDQLKDVMDTNKDQIKDQYITYKLFADSAIRDKLRKMGIAPGRDEVIPHLERLAKSKSRHIDKQSVRHTITRHKKRVAQAKHSLKEM